MTQSTNHSPQQHWQEIAIKLAGFEPDTFQGAKFAWWRNPINQDSLRLTKSGFEWFTKQAKMTAYKIEVDKDIHSLQIIQLERQLHEPYYFPMFKGQHIGFNIWVFSQTDAVMLQLHGGDLAQYLQNLEDTAG